VVLNSGNWVVPNPGNRLVLNRGNSAVTALKDRFGITTAVNVSAGIRVFYHFYQGALGVVGIAPMALLFAYWFARTGRLWPLIVAHALTDFAGLAASISTG
jgi:membrane protease YdiL (CAAX protease family)